MHSPLRIGIAGFGTVGTGVLDALRPIGADSRTRRTPGRDCRGVGRSRNKPRGDHELDSRVAWYDDPVALASAGECRSVRRTDRRRGRSRQNRRSRRRSRPESRSSPPTRRCSPITARRWRGSPRRRASRSTSKPRSRAAFRSSRRCARRWPATARQGVRHPQRHLQLHPDQDGE